LDFVVLHPAPGQTQHQSNAQSCVLRISNGQQAALLPGDLPSAQEQMLLQSGAALAATVLVAGHHGSAGSSSVPWLRAVAPRWVLVQAGYDNRYGHPAPAMLERLKTLGLAWRSTVSCGALRWQSNTPDTLGCWRQQAGRYWQHQMPAQN
jgi:competence protein ComEC